VLSPQIDRDGRIDQWPEGFFDEFDKSLEALLAPRRADSDGNGVQ
jgi:predicted ATPase